MLFQTESVSWSYSFGREFPYCVTIAFPCRVVAKTSHRPPICTMLQIWLQKGIDFRSWTRSKLKRTQQGSWWQKKPKKLCRQFLKSEKNTGISVGVSRRWGLKWTKLSVVKLFFANVNWFDSFFQLKMKIIYVCIKIRGVYWLDTKDPSTIFT